MVQISVAPIPGGWLVHASLIDNPLVFLSGAQAERAARRLAQAAAAAGFAVALEISTRDGCVVFSDHRPPMPGRWKDGPPASAGAGAPSAPAAGGTPAGHDGWA